MCSASSGFFAFLYASCASSNLSFSASHSAYGKNTSAASAEPCDDSRRRNASSHFCISTCSCMSDFVSLIFSYASFPQAWLPCFLKYFPQSCTASTSSFVNCRSTSVSRDIHPLSPMIVIAFTNSPAASHNEAASLHAPVSSAHMACLFISSFRFPPFGQMSFALSHSFRSENISMARLIIPILTNSAAASSYFPWYARISPQYCWSSPFEHSRESAIWSRNSMYRTSRMRMNAFRATGKLRSESACIASIRQSDSVTPRHAIWYALV
ncbi:hypothetical protein DIPPA_05201 [Diplonema papillatum]|nr:hypothetical protein DIPPA_28226 [Diplonema papillatum]KAJ9471462.1 hypothetical protein DIPPA_05201 [Diplonema papillatum]